MCINNIGKGGKHNELGWKSQSKSVSHIAKVTRQIRARLVFRTISIRFKKCSSDAGFRRGIRKVRSMKYDASLGCLKSTNVSTSLWCITFTYCNAETPRLRFVFTSTLRQVEHAYSALLLSATDKYAGLLSYPLSLNSFN